MRCDQHMGLNAWATEFLEAKAVKLVKVERITTVEGQLVSETEYPIPNRKPCGEYEGMFGNPYTLWEYQTSTLGIVREYVQAAPWSSGPCHFLALKDVEGNPISDSLWSQEDIDNA